MSVRRVTILHEGLINHADIKPRVLRLGPDFTPSAWPLRTIQWESLSQVKNCGGRYNAVFRLWKKSGAKELRYVREPLGGLEGRARLKYNPQRHSLATDANPKL